MTVPDRGGAPPPVANVANLLTAARVVLVPVMAAMLVAAADGSALWRVAACVTFAVASVTDLYDGKLARARNEVTRLGQIADPIADKALTGTALVGLSWLGLLPWWVTGLILAREAVVTLLRFWVIRDGVIPASRGGKLKTLLQVVAICWYLLPWPPSADVVGPPLMALAVLVTWVTGVDYLVRAVGLRRSVRRRAVREPAVVEHRPR